MTIGDLPPKHQAEIVQRLGRGKPLGQARTKELLAIEVVPHVDPVPARKQPIPAAPAPRKP